MFGFVWVRNKAFQGDVSEFQVAIGFRHAVLD